MQLRPYQVDVINDTRAKIRELSKTVTHRKPRIIVQMPPGAGKTLTSAAMAKSAIDKGGTVAFLCHRDFLMEQTSQTYKKLGIEHSYIASGKWLNAWSKCHIGMIGSMKSRQRKIKAPSLCFIDEAHHAPAKSWNAILDAWPETTFILLSGTPGGRTDGIGLGTIADGIVNGPSVSDLIVAGALSDYEYYAPSTPDLSQARVKMKEYVTHDVDVEMSKSIIIGNIVDSYKKHANRTIAVYFAPSIETSRKYAQAFNEAGIPAAHVDADTPSHERTAVAKKLASREIFIMCNVGIACEGYDLSAQAGADVTIETVGLCRPTKSFPLLVQMAMRAMRAKSYSGIILDHAGSYQEHNWLPDDHVEWSLENGATREETQGIQHCESCGAALKRGKRVCHSCGFANVALMEGEGRGRGGPMHIDGDLLRIQREEERRVREVEINQMKKDRAKAKSLEELIEIEKRMGYRSGWARHAWRSKQSRGIA